MLHEQLTEIKCFWSTKIITKAKTEKMKLNEKYI